MKIGILTGGGDCPGLNAVIRAVVKTARTSYNMEVLGFNDGYHGLITNQSRRLGRRDISGILPRGGTILGTSNRDNPFKYTEVIDGQKITHDVSGRVMDNIEKNGIGAMIIVGGDGTLSIANQFYKMGVPLVGIPKTIDNDISATGVTFGFDTALVTATEAIDKIHTTGESHHRVMIVEVMGRTAGWIALHSGLAGGAHIILIPEIPFSYDAIVNKIVKRSGYGKHFSIIVVAEGAKPKGGNVVVKRMVEDASEPCRLGGIGNVIGDIIEKRTNIETRVTTLGHIQRGGTPSAFDRILSTRFGVEAVKLVNEKNFGKMVSLRTPDIVPVSLEDAVGQIKYVPADCGLLETARLMDISLGE
ncbi:MAG: ATP-dependent 6-phosphofructokinase [Nitrospinota bacterium]|nr:ATP-dependent 6-phosphofructokinase [Nitrospinota bacterium]